jgi:hypothetical protein
MIIVKSRFHLFGRDRWLVPKDISKHNGSNFNKMINHKWVKQSQVVRCVYIICICN